LVGWTRLRDDVALRGNFPPPYSKAFLDALAATAFLSLLACLLSPYFYILHLRTRKLEKFEKLFPEALDSLVRAGSGTGHPFAAGMEVLAGEALPPVATEMRKTLDEWKLGMQWNQALDNLTKRVPLTDVYVFVAAVKLQMKTGGRLGRSALAAVRIHERE